MKSKCLRGKKRIEAKVDENQTFKNIEFLMCILAKNLPSLSLPVTLLWQCLAALFILSRWWCAVGRGDDFQEDSLSVCAQYLFCVIRFKSVCCIFQVLISLQKYFKFLLLMSVFNNYKVMTFSVVVPEETPLKKSAQRFLCKVRALVLTWCSNFLKVQDCASFQDIKMSLCAKMKFITV